MGTRSARENETRTRGIAKHETMKYFKTSFLRAFVYKTGTTSETTDTKVDHELHDKTDAFDKAVHKTGYVTVATFSSVGAEWLQYPAARRHIYSIAKYEDVHMRTGCHFTLLMET
jgi:hypothetical protein